MTGCRLHEWLLEQIREDERLASAEVDNYANERRPSESTHQAAWAPARVLVECWTKRRIIDLAVDAMAASRRSDRYIAAEELTQATLQLLAEPYAHQPG